MPNQGLFDAALQKINKRLQEKIVTLEAELFSANNKIAALESDLKRRVTISGPTELNVYLSPLAVSPLQIQSALQQRTALNANEPGNTKRFARGIYSPAW
jgi:hypothetical protein